MRQSRFATSREVLIPEDPPKKKESGTEKPGMPGISVARRLSCNLPTPLLREDDGPKKP